MKKVYPLNRFPDHGGQFWIVNAIGVTTFIFSLLANYALSSPEFRRTVLARACKGTGEQSRREEK